MNNQPMENEYLYATVVPVLLGNGPKAWQTASSVYLRHAVNPHWFGRGVDFKINPNVKRHILPAPLWEISHPLLLQILLDFAAEENGILALFPCDEDALAFVNGCRPDLESRYVILMPSEEGDPLAPLIRKND